MRPMMSTIRPGVIEIFAEENGDAERLFLKGGLAQVSPAGLTILAEEAIALESVDSADLAQENCRLSGRYRRRQG